MRRWAALVIIWGLGAVSGSMVGWTSALFTSTTSNPGNSFAAAASFCPTPSSQTIVVTQDTYVREDAPGSNFGVFADLRVYSDSNKDHRTLVYFPLPSKPAGCMVSSAILRLYATTVSPGRTMEAYRLAATPSWTETGVTWSNQPPTAGTAATSSSGSVTGWKEWNVTSQVDLMYSGTNNGFLVRDQMESAGSLQDQIYQSRDVGANDPELVITFAGVACSNPGSQTVLTTKDSFVEENNAGTNFGTVSTLSVVSDAGRNRRTLVYFPLTAVPPDCVFTLATLRLNASAADSSRTIDVYRAAAAWTETGVSWSNQPGNAGTAVSASSGTGWREWDVTTHVSAMYSGTNEGFKLRDQTEGAGGAGETQTYSSREGSNDPQLVLRFG